jgi:hypothetical protein
MNSPAKKTPPPAIRSVPTVLARADALKDRCLFGPAISHSFPRGGQRQKAAVGNPSSRVGLRDACFANDATILHSLTKYTEITFAMGVDGVRR